MDKQRRPVLTVVGADVANQYHRHRDRTRDGGHQRKDGDGWDGHHYGEDQQWRAHEEPDKSDESDLNDAEADAGRLDEVGALLDRAWMGGS